MPISSHRKRKSGFLKWVREYEGKKKTQQTWKRFGKGGEGRRGGRAVKRAIY